MRWQGGRRGGGIEDRRGMGGGAVAGGGIGVLVLAAIGYFVFGIDPNTTQQVASQFGGASQGQQTGEVGSPDDQAGQFVEIVRTNINDVWATKLRGYKSPNVVLYEQGTQTGCGMGQAAMGPFYCPADQTVYLDLSFWREMETKLGASGADFAKAYVIAHEFGHHVQTLTGASEQVQRAQQAARSQAEGNKYSVALELQADCYAGVWARNAAAVSGGQVALEPGDLEEGMKTAQAIGDDTLQRRGGGRVSPESFTHGSSAQRVEWLQRGYQTGDPASCDTFRGL
ncbi:MULTISPECIES: neutral zinc metallopeptidase [unclassified Brevundimonas]|uniref:KPN_02809 family neutral zinc metallopeptidase n=1 Tax=unclassified Brevundimonas TaxID=2622653 RepID=UPI000CFBAB0B|nr:MULTISPECIES: neutral zinc metallopeptidase [unclassified Brevundimonas]PRA30412.1 flagellar biosynthesis protein FlgM [Brevundimonas sp. MYb27]PQZ83310.1 flagellar biosynthesis protein FlgM [Brevundimonas sp. MYb31]PRB16157.1 flagellar biosynthesis protein FlgM [Brevundimonas sp. MYb52]PRB35232.1 flagellar biosynthesis protein FlgM [Brevundimonas sp. MYb46]PRB46127.1 flagellar biosynthesis protein FlgM [Brevundimonas sp. MYb33]